MSKLQKTWLMMILAIPPGIPIVLHAYLASFTRLMADDYCTMYFTNRLGVLRTAWYWYLNFAGVFSRSLLNKILQVAGPNNMSVIVPGILIIRCLATALVIYLMLAGDMPTRERIWSSISLSIMFVSTVLLISPQLTQSLYWWGGLSAYTIPLVLATFYVFIFLVFTQIERGGKTVAGVSILSFFIAFGLGGISESFTPILLVFITFVAGWGLLTKQLNPRHPASWFLGAGMLGSALALITMISAPGNAVRQSFFPSPPGIIDIFQIAITGYLDFLNTLFFEPQKWTGILGAFLGSMLLGINSTNAKPPKAWSAPAIFFLGIFFAFLCFPPAVYGTSEAPPNRVLVISAYALTIGLIVSGYVGGTTLSFRIPKFSTRALINGMMLVTTLMIGYSSWITSKQLYESRSTFIEFASKWDQVHAQILQAKVNGEESITLPAMDNWAGLERPNENKRYWVNKCYSAYYGIQVYGPPYGK